MTGSAQASSTLHAAKDAAREWFARGLSLADKRVTVFDPLQLDEVGQPLFFGG